LLATGTDGKAPLKKVEEYLWNAAECRTIAETPLPAHRQRLREMAESWEKLAELETKRHPAAENKNVIEFVLPSNDSKRKK
jgi:hypothetical protein